MQGFSAQSRSTILKNATNETYDLLIVGGGIVGAGILLEASRRGLKTLLVEQHDFGSGTSSASSKLIHGGLRYLEIGDFHQVFESCKDRKHLLKLVPELVHPLEFLFPIYKGQRRNLWTIYIGTWIYFLLAIFRNLGTPKKCNSQKTSELAPLLKRERLTGSVRYFDASTIDSRLTLSTIKTSLQFGGKACNHAKVIRYVFENEKVTGATVQDEITQQEYEIKAKQVVSAVGPWTDESRKAFLQKDTSKVRLSKGVHIIVKGNPFQITTAIVMLAPTDGRVMFLIPWLGDTMIGTTDDDYQGSPDELTVTSQEIEYLKNTAYFYFPSVAISNEQILSTFAGLRCLQPANHEHPSDVTREEILFSDSNGLLTVAGGKLTSFLSMAEKIVHRIVKQNGWNHPSRQKLHQFTSISKYTQDEQPSENFFSTLIDQEMATTIQDLLRYRTLRYYFSKDHAQSWISLAAETLKKKLNYSDEEINRQKNEFQQQIQKQSLST